MAGDRRVEKKKGWLRCGFCGIEHEVEAQLIDGELRLIMKGASGQLFDAQGIQLLNEYD